MCVEIPGRCPGFLLNAAETIPAAWLDVLARKKDVGLLAGRLQQKLQ